MQPTRKTVGIVAGTVGAAAIAVTAFLFSTPVTLPPGGDLQAAINAAQPGDVITLEAGSSYSCPGGCILPNKSGAEFITIKSSRYEEIPVRAMDSLVPVEDTVALMAHVSSSFSTEPVFRAEPGAHHYKLLGLNITVPAGQATRLIELGISGAAQDTPEEMPHHFVLDKLWVHGAVNQEVQRCVALNSSDTEITNSWFTDCHGRGYDSQAIGGWNGGGNYKIINNSLSGAGENFMLGGSPASIPNLIPTNVEFRRNHVWKPLTWHERDASYAGIKWTVKNSFELKNARNVIIDGNVFNGNWTDAQAGRAIQFTPRPSDSGSWATIEDVQFTNNIIRNTGAGANILGADEPPAPTETRLRRVRIANNLWEIDGARFGSDGVFLVVTNKTEDVTVENNTVSHTGNVVSTDYAPNTRFIYRNNISRHNSYGIFGSGSGVGNPSIAQYFPGSTIAGNVMAREVGGPSNAASLYPAGNYFPETVAAIGLGADYRLAASSPYKGKGTDGKDPGCDIDALNAALGGNPAPVPTVSVTPAATPSASGESANNTRIPTATQIIDSSGGTWTRQPDGIILRNGAGTGGTGSVVLYCQRTVYVFGTDSQWYRWSGGWQATGKVDPCGAAPSPSATPTQVPTPQPSPTAQPLPSPSPTVAPSPRPSPSLPICGPNAIVGDPARCLCVTGIKNNCRCR